jgi:hypothetical protein
MDPFDQLEHPFDNPAEERPPADCPALRWSS